MKRKRKSFLAPGKRLPFTFVLLAVIAGLLFVLLIIWPAANRVPPTTSQDHQAPAFLPEAGTDFVYSSGNHNDGAKISPGPDALVTKKGNIALVIDDAGNDLQALDQFIAFPGKMSVAILPELPHSRESAQKTHVAGKEVILHLPLEPLGKENPGPGAVLVSFDRDRIRGILDRDFESVPYAVGVNNHMGSLATQDRNVMDVLLAYLKGRGVFFVDSRTVASTLGKEYAIKYSVPWAERNFFLDNNPDKAGIRRVLNDGVVYARLHGQSLLIAHVQNRLVLDVLLEEYDDLVSSGVGFITVSEFIRDKNGEGN
jgi:polysaccharide deacetylase 2 family uncharacterized protein YibQ